MGELFNQGSCAHPHNEACQNASHYYDSSEPRCSACKGEWEGIPTKKERALTFIKLAFLVVAFVMDFAPGVGAVLALMEVINESEFGKKMKKTAKKKLNKFQKGATKFFRTGTAKLKNTIRRLRGKTTHEDSSSGSSSDS